MDRTVRASVIAVVLVVSLGWAGPALGVGGSSTDAIDPTDYAIVDGPGPGPAQQAPSSFDFVEFHITVDEDASARWTVRYTRVLRNESEVTSFEAFADDFNENETPFFENFRQQAEGLATAGRNETGRDMTAGEFERDAHIESGGLTNDLGVVSVSFRWGDFAAIRDGRLHVGDVFTGGLYIGPEQRLTIAAGDGLRFADADGDGLAVDPAPDSVDAGDEGGNGSVSWSGERLFGDGRPRAVLVPVDEGGVDGDGGAGDGGTGDGAGDGGAGDGTDGGGDDPGSDGPDGSTTLAPWSMLAGGLVLVVVLGAVGWWWRRGASPAGVDDGSQAGGAAAASAGRSPRPIPDEELLSDEDRVVRMLEHNGGRMKQVDIVNETDWSKSKVSMLLSDMEEEGTVSKLRVGRENIVSLAGHEPEATRSALERGDE